MKKVFLLVLSSLFIFSTHSQEINNRYRHDYFDTCEDKTDIYMYNRKYYNKIEEYIQYYKEKNKNNNL